MKLRQLENKLAELICKRIDLGQQIRNYPDVTNKKKYFEEQLNDNRELTMTVGSVFGDDIKVVNFTAEKKQLERTIVHCCDNMIHYKEALVKELNETEAEIERVETEISNHWTNRLKLQLWYLGVNMRVSSGGY